MPHHEYRKKVCFIEQVKECFDLAAQIQNAEIATVFINFWGHINEIEIKVHYPYWQKDSKAGDVVSFYARVNDGEGEYTEEEQNEMCVKPAINRLKEILATADQRKSDLEISAENERRRRLELFQELQQEFSSLQLQKAI